MGRESVEGGGSVGFVSCAWCRMLWRVDVGVGKMSKGGSGWRWRKWHPIGVKGVAMHASVVVNPRVGRNDRTAEEYAWRSTEARVIGMARGRSVLDLVRAVARVGKGVLLVFVGMVYGILWVSPSSGVASRQRTAGVLLFLMLLGGVAVVLFLLFRKLDSVVQTLACVINSDENAAVIPLSCRPRRIVLIRHGESLANVDLTVYARTPDHKICLTNQGEEQARTAGEELRRLTGQGSIAFYVSPYSRAVQTLDGILRGGKFSPNQFQVREEPHLREQEFGNLQDPALFDHYREQRKKMGGFFFRMPCGESSADVYARASLFLDSLHREWDNRHCTPFENAVIVSHGLTIRMLLMRFFRWTVEDVGKIAGPRNGELWILEKIESSGRYKLVTEIRSYDEEKDHGTDWSRNEFELDHAQENLLHDEVGTITGT